MKRARRRYRGRLKRSRLASARAVAWRFKDHVDRIEAAERAFDRRNG